MDNYIIDNNKIRMQCDVKNLYCERIFVKSDKEWVPVLCSVPFATIPTDERHFAAFAQEPTEPYVKIEGESARICLEHPDYTVSRTIRLSQKADAVDFTVTFRAKKKITLRALEDKWNFLPDRREQDDALTGPLDFVWSQRIKTLPADFVSHYNFRTPIVMMQQGEIFAGIVPGLENVKKEELDKAPLGMDLDVTRDRYPWMSYGVIVGQGMTPDKPCEAGHSHIVRGSGLEFCRVVLDTGDEITYSYSIIVSPQPVKLGYRYAVRYLWQRYGAPQMELEHSLPDNPRFPDVKTLKQWQLEIWDKNAENDYFSYTKDGKTVGGITGRRQGEWFSRTDHKHDLWYACWLQELVTGYGTYLYGKSSGKHKWMERAEQILNHILSAPRTMGMFPVICYYESDGSETWLKDDGWAGYRNEFHTLHMSWTAWLMLRWGTKAFPGRMEDILEFCKPYADFLIARQHEDGCIPSWYDDDGNPSRVQFRDFNAETATSALFLMEIGEIAKNEQYLAVGMKGLDFITEYVIPRKRWFDLETFLSCSRKDFDFYDSITAQYPQCNLSQIHASIAYLKRYHITQKESDLKLAEQMADYLLLTQQLWNHPLLHINSFGGFTVQNADNEWSDVREGLCAMLLYQYYLATGKQEYLERSVAAMHAGFEVLPYENWAHCGYEGMQYDSSLLWGGGVILTAAEYLDAEMGAMAIDADGGFGTGIDGCVVKKVEVNGDEIFIDATFVGREEDSPFSMRVFSRNSRKYTIKINDRVIGEFSPEQLKNKILINGTE